MISHVDCSNCGNSIDEHSLKKVYIDGDFSFICPICKFDLSDTCGAYVRNSRYCFLASSSQVYKVHMKR